ACGPAGERTPVAWSPARPNRLVVEIDARRHPPDCPRRQRKDADERVVAAPADRPWASATQARRFAPAGEVSDDKKGALSAASRLRVSRATAHPSAAPSVARMVRTQSGSAIRLIAIPPVALARPARLERATCGFEVRRSIQLSYGRITS